MKKIYSLLFTIIFAASANVNAQCVADYLFSTNPNNLNVSFTNTSTHPPAMQVSYHWWFSDGNASSTQTNPSHTFSQAGTYIVYLSMFDSLNTCFDSISYYVTVPSSCTAIFSYSQSSGGLVSFTGSTNVSNQAFISYNFGDGMSSYGNISPTHRYQSNGLYNVTLFVFDSITNCSATYADSLFVSNATSSCNASFTVTKDTSAQNAVLLINNSSNQSSHSYYWTFGDNNSSTLRNPQHTYSGFGSYLVCLTISDSILNCVATFCDTVGMDSLGNLKSGGFSMTVMDPIVTSIEEKAAEKTISVFPNPVEDRMRIDFEAFDGAVQLRIFNLSGKLVREIPSINNLNSRYIDVSDLTNGVYFLQLSTGSESSVTKFIKQ